MDSKGKMNLKGLILKCIETSDFIGLEKLFSETEVAEDFEESLSMASFDNRSLVSYTFYCMLLMKKETVQLHIGAATLLMHQLCSIEDAYASALYHVRKSIELDPEEIGLKELLIFFHNIPDRVVSKEEAIEAAFQVLKEYPSSMPAKDLLEKYEINS